MSDEKTNRKVVFLRQPSDEKTLDDFANELVDDLLDRVDEIRSQHGLPPLR